MSEKLLPCPHCGGVDIKIEPDGGVVNVTCSTCWAAGGYDKTAEGAVAAWNRRSSPSQVAPANPAQVTEADRKAVQRGEASIAEFNRLHSTAANPAQVMEPTVNELFANCDRWSAIEWFNRLAMAIHSRDKAVVEGNDLSFATYDNIAKSSAARLVHDFEQGVRAALTAAIGAGGQAVAEDTETLKARAASVLCEAGALCGWPAPNCNAREGAEALFKAGLLAISQPHHADERVVEALADLDEVRKAVFGDVGDEPDVYADYDRCSELCGKMARAIAALSAKEGR